MLNLRVERSNSLVWFGIKGQPLGRNATLRIARPRELHAGQTFLEAIH